MLDDSGNWPSAVAGLRTDPHLRWILEDRVRRQHAVYVAWLYGDVHVAFGPVHCSGVPHNRRGAENRRPAAQDNRVTIDAGLRKDHGIYLVLDRRRHAD